MSNTAIKVENLSKQYRLGEVGTGTLSHDLNRWWAYVRGKEDPFAKIGEVNDQTKRGSSEYVWALKDINFKVNRGEVLGIIGRNGAGKSTLLKILSKITQPTTGTIKIKGRIASLLEVGTGFHPELTGRENIFLNGAILGMTKTEIRSKFDEIVNFAGVEKYIDTPVKRYSSGMYVRLAFAVAAHLEPEILIVDEVLAVGDAEFQKKCLGKMQDVSKNDGRTILFVSHNLIAVRQLCRKGLFLGSGEVQTFDNLDKAVGDYLNSTLKAEENSFENLQNKPIYISRFEVHDFYDKAIGIAPGSKVAFVMQVTSKIVKKNVNIGIGINDDYGLRIFTLFTKYYGKFYEINIGKNEYTCVIDNLPLKPGRYSVHLYIGNDYEPIDYIDSNASFSVNEFPYYPNFSPDHSQGPLVLNQQWI